MTPSMLLTYFKNLSDQQQEQIHALSSLYEEWNSKINVISRKDMADFYTHHVLHSLTIAKFCPFRAGTSILDLGTGGGFPGIPLAILFPEVQFKLIDGTGKKIKVVQEVAAALGLQNVHAMQKRAEELKGERFDFVVSRAVAELAMLWQWCQPLIHEQHKNALPNGLIALKGGNLKGEIKALPKGVQAELTPVLSFFKEPYFEEKFIVYVQR